MMRALFATIVTLAATSLAGAAPVIDIVAPAPGEPVHGGTPLVTVTYSAPTPGVNLDTLQVLVNGADWTARFSKSASSASYQVTSADALVAGTLTLEASIRDAAGVLATTAHSYALHPSLATVAPARGAVGIVVTVSAQGLDPLADHNILLFPSAQVGPPLRVPFTTVDPGSGTGEAIVPAGTRSGEVGLEVNARVAQTGKLFLVAGNYVSCGMPWDMRFFANGDILMLYSRYYGVIGAHTADLALADPECYLFDYGITQNRSVLARLTPTRGMSVLRHMWPAQGHDDGAILGIAMSKDGQRYAYMERDTLTWVESARYSVRTNNNTSVGLIGVAPRAWDFIDTALSEYHPIPMDFDTAGNLYFAAFHEPEILQEARLKLYRISAALLASGSNGVMPEVVRTFNEYRFWIPPTGAGSVGPTGLRIGCDGTVYLSLLGGSSFIRRTSLTGAPIDVEWPLGLPSTGKYKLRAMPSCQGDELVASYNHGFLAPDWLPPDIAGYRIVNGTPSLLGAVSQPRVQLTPNAVGPGTSSQRWTSAADVSPAWELMAAPWWGVTQIGSGPVACTGPPRPWPCPRLRVVSPTRRWRPLLIEAPVEIYFESPYELSSATIDVYAPDGSLAPAVTTAMEPVGELKYKLAWTGPWTRADGTPLPAGHYKIFVRGTPTAGGAQILSFERIVSFVEVNAVRLEAMPDTLGLDDNPPVPALVEQGQDPALGRPGGGKRIYAESTMPGGPVHNQVKVVVVTTPMLTPDPEVPADELRVRVFLRSLDVDDPAPSLPDLDGDAALDTVADNRGAPTSGELLTSWLDIEAGSASAHTTLNVSLQPGDNYRVAASTSAAWLADVQARQNVAPAAPVQDGALNVSGPQVSPMLTVWRTLHLEIDSMAPAPVGGSPEEYAQRNFISGVVRRISVSGPTLEGGESALAVIPRYVYVQPDQAEPVLSLSDGSAELPEQGGRFEKGRLTIGDGPGAVIVDPLDGNGTDSATGWEYLRAITTPPEPPRIDIPVRIRNGTLRDLHRSVVAWEWATWTFTLDQPVSAAYVGGTLIAAGLEWTVLAVNGADVVVSDDQPLDFHVVDDDPLQWPFAISTAYVSDSDSPLQNVFAHAYVRPRADLASQVQPPFIRNVWNTLPPVLGEAALRKAQLAAGREWQATPSFWRAYLQGAAQAGTRRDADPNSESAHLGLTQDLNDEHGSFIFLMTLRDQLLCPRPDQLQHTVAHELGHQFGLEHSASGLMAVSDFPECPHVPGWFTAAQLQSIRSKGVRP